jgi:hypothetical protein
VVFLGPDKQAIGFGLNIEFGDNIASVFFHRSIGNKKLGRDFFVRFVLGDQF